MSSSSRSQPTVLALLPNWLGDAVMAVPALRQLTARARVVGVGATAISELLVEGGVPLTPVRFERRGQDRGLAGLWRSGRALRRQAATECVVFPPSLRAAALARLAAPPRRIGFGGEGRALLLNRVRAPWGGARRRHLADQWLEMVGGDPSTAPARPELSISPRMAAAAAAIRDRAGVPDRFLVVAPGATFGPTKRWPGFGQLLEELWAAHRLPAVIVGSDAPAERELAASLRGPGVIDLTGQTDLVALAGLLGSAAGFVGNDSGPMHLAASLGVPTLGVFGSTNPAWTGPRGERAAVVGPAPVPCSPCYRAQCPTQLECLHQLEVATVRNALESLLGRASVSREDQG